MFLTSDHVADGFPPPSRVGVLETVGQDGQASRPLGGHSRPDCEPHSFVTYLKPVTMYRCQLPQTQRKEPNSGARQSQIWSGAEAPSPSGRTWLEQRGLWPQPCPGQVECGSRQRSAPQNVLEETRARRVSVLSGHRRRACGEMPASQNYWSVVLYEGDYYKKKDEAS